MAILADMDLQPYPSAPLLPRAWELRDNFTVADALYVALAERLGAPMLTTDERLARAPEQHTEVEMIPR